MIIVSFNGFDFNANGFSCDFPDGADRNTFGIEAQMRRRPGYSAVATGVAVTEMTVAVEIGYDGAGSYEDAWATLMAGLEPTKTHAKELVAERNDGTEVSCMARVILPQGLTLSEDVNFVQATFVSESPEWRVTDAPDPVTHSQTTTDDPTWSAGTPYTALGSAPISPLVTIDPATTGTQPRRYSFTIGHDHPWTLPHWPQFVHLGDTTGWTDSTEANTYVYCDGLEVPREVVAIKEARSYLIVVPDSIAKDQVKEYEVVTGGATPAEPTAPQELNGRARAIVPDPGWQVITATSGGTSVVTMTGMSTGTPYEAAPTNRWKGGAIFGLTGAGAGQAWEVSASDATTITATGSFTAFTAGAKFLVMASYLNVVSTHLNLLFATRLTEHTDYPHGLWYEGSAQDASGDVRYDSPATWRPVKSFRDQDNRDAIAQPSVTRVDPPDDYFTILNAYRTWEHGLKNSDVRERGAADGVTFSAPLPITNFRRELTFENPNAVAKAVVGSRQILAEDWTEVYTDGTAHATPTTLSDTNHTLPSGTRHLLVALWPNIGSAIPTSWARDTGGRTSGGASSLSDDSKSWLTNQWVGARLRITYGKGQGGSFTVTSNDANTLNFTPSISDNDLIPNNGSRYEVTQAPLIANLRSGSIWRVTLDVTGVTISGLTDLGTAERVAVRLRAGDATDNVQLDVGAGDRRLFVAPDNTVVVDADAQTAYVMDGATVVKDVTAWVESYEQEGGAARTTSKRGWFPVDPGSGDLAHQRTAGASTYAFSVVLRHGYLG